MFSAIFSALRDDLACNPSRRLWKNLPNRPNVP
jgi:hypothetical protein